MEVLLCLRGRAAAVMAAAPSLLQLVDDLPPHDRPAAVVLLLTAAARAPARTRNLCPVCRLPVAATPHGVGGENEK